MARTRLDGAIRDYPFDTRADQYTAIAMALQASSKGGDMTSGDSQRKGRCHCGKVRFEVRLESGFASAIRCTCSLCRMRGAVVVLSRLEDFAVNAGEDNLTEYRFNTGAARHFFCKSCGVYTHHQRRFDPNQFAINAACLEDVSPFDFKEVRVVDGINHPLDGDGVLRTAGILRYEPATSSSG